MDLINHCNEDNSKISYYSNSTNHSNDKLKNPQNETVIKAMEFNIDKINISNDNQEKVSKNSNDNNNNSLIINASKNNNSEEKKIYIIDYKDDTLEENLAYLKDDLIKKKIITKVDEQIKNLSVLSEKFEEGFTKKNFTLTENSISFEINFEKWCRKTFNKNIEENKNNTEIVKDKEKDILKNGNIDEIYEYINGVDVKKNGKKKNKKKKNKKNKNMEKDFNCNNNINSENKENSNLANNINKQVNVNNDLSKLYDAEVELFKQNIVKDNKKASDIIKIKPIFSANWLEMLN